MLGHVSPRQRLLCCPQCLRDAKLFFQRESVCLKDLSCVRLCRHASTPNHSSADGALHKPFATPSLAIGTCEVIMKPCGARRTISLTMCKRAHVPVNCGAHILAKRKLILVYVVTRQTMRKKETRAGNREDRKSFCSRILRHQSLF